MVEDELSLVLVVEVVVVVCVVLEVVSGVVDWLGDVVVLGVVDCELLGEVDVLWAATQTADSSRIAVIRYSFFICVLLILPACISCGPFRVVGSSANRFRLASAAEVCLEAMRQSAESRAVELLVRSRDGYGGGYLGRYLIH
jgi:hypothetical protein